jgi:DNA invertase Pin-like site-specific DNA recombinase
MTTLRAACYTRYSTKKQSDLSTADQLRICTEYAAKNDYVILPEHCYEDAATSGARAANRPGLQKLLAAARRKPKPFDVVLTENTGRSSRDPADMFPIRRDLDFLGIPTVWISDGFRSTDEHADALLMMKALSDAATLKTTSQQAYRGISSQLLRGFAAGGTCYGYRRTRTGTKMTLDVRSEIDEAQANVVRRIFTLCVSGYSLGAIASTLNAEGIQPPRTKRGWHQPTIGLMLRNELYRGQLIYHRHQIVKSPAGDRVLRPRPESEWLRVERPELRIIDDDLWQAVQLQRERSRERSYHRGGNLHGLGRGSAHLLSGFLKCSECGQNLAIVAGYGTGRKPRYGCPNNNCSNDLRETESALLDRLLGRLQAAVLTVGMIEFAIEEFQKQLNTQLAGVTAHLDADRKRETVLQRELKNLWAAVAKGGDFDSLKDEIAERDRELKAIRERVLTAGRDSVDAEIAGIRDYVIKSLVDLKGLLSLDIPAAKAWLAEHIGEDGIVMTPAGEHYVASGNWDLCGGMEPVSFRPQQAPVL